MYGGEARGVNHLRAREVRKSAPLSWSPPLGWSTLPGSSFESTGSVAEQQADRNVELERFPQLVGQIALVMAGKQRRQVAGESEGGRSCRDLCDIVEPKRLSARQRGRMRIGDRFQPAVQLGRGRPKRPLIVKRGRDLQDLFDLLPGERGGEDHRHI